MSELKGRKMFSRTTKILLIVFLVVFIIGGVTIPWLNWIKLKEETAYRSNNLRAWYGGVKLFIQKNNRLPNSLYEVYRDRIKEGDANMSFVVSLVAKLSEEDVQNMPDDPQQFEERVKYGLFSDRYGWVIRELERKTVYPRMLMIDQNGTIYQVQEITQDR